MATLKLQRTSRIVQWAYLLDCPPHQTSLCGLFWRVVLITPLTISAPISLLLWALWLIGVIVWRHPLDTAIVLALVGSGICAFIVIAICVRQFSRWIDKRNNRACEEAYDRLRRNEPPPPRVIRDGFRAIKAKVCPIVELT